jgi:hypothetical protein
MNNLKFKCQITLFLIITILLFSCNNYTTSNNAKINFPNTEHDFGLLEYKKGAEFEIEFKNSGDTPLVIQNVKTSCGCTIPKWPKKPIKPGKKEALLIKYDSAYPGKFKKTIAVFFNGEDSPVNLTIKGEVEYPDNI